MEKKRFQIVTAGLGSALASIIAAKAPEADIVLVEGKKPEPPPLAEPKVIGPVVSRPHMDVNHRGPHQYEKQGGLWVCQLCSHVLK